MRYPTGRQLRVPLQLSQPLPRAALPHFWHPDREGVEHCDADFARDLALVSPDLRACRPPARAPIPKARWAIWMRKAAVTHPLCPGWALLFAWPSSEYPDPIPLDNRVFANLYLIDSRRFANGAQYFDRILTQMETEKESRTASHKADVADHVKDFWDATKIKNIGRGNKFALHHDGTVVPSRGEANWIAERDRFVLPASVTRERNERRVR